MKAIGYVRCSTDQQVQSGLGLEAQREAIRDYANRAGLVLDSIQADEGISGASPLEKRPGLMTAISSLARGDSLIVYRRDRLGRDVVNVALIERLVTKVGARVISTCGEGTDDNSPSSVLIRTVLDAVNQYERLVIGARTKAALSRLKAQGKRAGEVPFGFRALESGELVKDEGEQEVIAAVLDARARGLSQRAIVAEIRGAGLVSRSGRPLGRSQVRRILERAA